METVLLYNVIKRVDMYGEKGTDTYGKHNYS